MIDIRGCEASSGDLDSEDREPVFIARRSSGSDVIRGLLTCNDRVVRVEIELLDASLAQEDVRELFVGAYLRELTDDYYRAHADRVELVWKDRSQVLNFPYPD